MARGYSEKAFILEIDDYSLVEEYFKNRNIDGFSYTKDDKKKKRQVAEEMAAKIEAVLGKQPEQIKQEIDRDFSDINKLSDSKGTENLLAEAKDKNITYPADILLKHNGHEIAFWFFNKHKDIFDGANAVQEFFTSGWKRVPVPNKPITTIEKNRAALEQALKTYYQNKDEGLGQRCLVDVYPKKDRVYVVAYVSARGTNDIIPDEKSEGKLKKSTRRESIEIFYLYLQGDNDNGGELEIKARGGYTTQSELLGVFSQSVLNHTLDDTKQKYDLELLRDKNFSLVWDTEDEVEGWWLKGFHLRTPDGQTKIIVTIKDESRIGTETMWQKFSSFQLVEQMSVLRIDRADMKIKFKPTKKHPKGTKTFYITWKDTSSLNDIDDLDVKAGQILKKSKLDCGFAN